MVVIAGIALPIIYILLYMWLGTGAEMNCGIGRKAVPCFLPGATWLVTIRDGSFIVAAIAMLFMIGFNKEKK